MAKWICKCGKLLSTNVEIYEEVEEYEFVSEKETRMYIEDSVEGDSLKYFDFERDVTQNSFYQCQNCGRLWFDSDSMIVSKNSKLSSQKISNNIISFKYEED